MDSNTLSTLIALTRWPVGVLTLVTFTTGKHIIEPFVSPAKGRGDDMVDGLIPSV